MTWYLGLVVGVPAFLIVALLVQDARRRKRPMWMTRKAPTAPSTISMTKRRTSRPVPAVRCAMWT